MQTNSCRNAIFTTLVVCLTFCVASSCRADDAHLLLFESGKEGYPRYRIPTLVVARNGALVAICEGRADGGGLTGNVDLVSKRSSDNGKTWTARTLVAEAADDTLGNASALVDRDTGVIWIAGTISPGK
jgi:sialidase-1